MKSTPVVSKGFKTERFEVLTQVKAYWGKTIPTVRETPTVPVSLLVKCSLLNLAPTSLSATADLASPRLERQVHPPGQ